MYNNNYRKYGPSAYEEEFDVLQGLNSYVSKVYGWMFAGLLITAIVAYLVSTSEIIVVSIISNPLLYFGLFIVELILVGSFFKSWKTELWYSNCIIYRLCCS